LCRRSEFLYINHPIFHQSGGGSDRYEDYAYSTEVTVEIMGVDGHGDFVIVSYQFDTGDDETTLRAREELDPHQHGPHVETALEEAG
jgi:hypothetical protein